MKSLLVIAIAFVAACTSGDHAAHTGLVHEDGDGSGGPDAGTQPVCGNGIVETGEQCDDGNTVSGDGCSSTCEIEACDLFPQSGCPTGEACDLADGGTTTCRMATTAGTADHHCTTDSNCAKGFTCVTDPRGTTSSCYEFCAADTDCAGVGSRCAINLADEAGNQHDVDVCSNACSMLAQTGCPSGEACFGIENGSFDYTDCRVPGIAGDDGTCSDLTDCAQGFACAGGLCLSYCEIGDQNGCLDDACTPFAPTLTIGGIEYGYCDDL